MRAPASTLAALLAACGTAPPSVAPIADGPNVRDLTALRLQSADPERAARFYAALLGATIESGAEADSFLVRADASGDALAFVPMDGSPEPVEPLRFSVRDVDAALVELAARGIPFTTTEPGATDCFVRFTDPDGRTVVMRGP